MFGGVGRKNTFISIAYADVLTFENVSIYTLHSMALFSLLIYT